MCDVRAYSDGELGNYKSLELHIMFTNEWSFLRWIQLLLLDSFPPKDSNIDSQVQTACLLTDVASGYPFHSQFCNEKKQEIVTFAAAQQLNLS